MPKKLPVRSLIDSQHDKGFETLPKSARQLFCHVFWSLWKNFISKNSVLVVSEILRIFVQILIPNKKYSLSVKVCV